MNKYLRDLREGDLEYLAENLREADKEEILCNSEDVLEALKESVELSYFVKVMDVSGKPMGLLGASEFQGNDHVIWAVATEEVNDHAIKFLRYSKDCIQMLFDISGATRLVNYTYAKNELHHRWLEWCGATLIREPLYVGPEGKPFFPFFIERLRYV